MNIIPSDFRPPGWRLLSIDPGMRYCGVALFQDEELIRGWLSHNNETWRRGPPCWFGMAQGVMDDLKEMGVGEIHVTAIEFPQVYAIRYQKGDQDDIIQLACTAGAVSSCVPAALRLGFLPREWKGQVPKPIHNSRVTSRLSDEELGRVEAGVTPHLRHNILDAIGIGQFTLSKAGLAKIWKLPKDTTADPGTP